MQKKMPLDGAKPGLRGGTSVHSREHKTSLVRCTDIFFEETYKPYVIILRAEKYARQTFYA